MARIVATFFLRALATLVIAAAPCVGMAQDSAPARGGEVPANFTLEDTLHLIAAKVNAQGEVKFVAYWKKSAEGTRGLSELSDDARGTTYDAAGCRVNYVWRAKLNGKAFEDFERPFDLKYVKQIQVLDEVKSLNFDGTSTKKVTGVSQPITEVWLGFADGPVRQFWFRDVRDADLVAKAFSHAVELCGGRLNN